MLLVGAKGLGGAAVSSPGPCYGFNSGPAGVPDDWCFGSLSRQQVISQGLGSRCWPHGHGTQWVRAAASTADGNLAGSKLEWAEGATSGSQRMTSPTKTDSWKCGAGEWMI